LGSLIELNDSVTSILTTAEIVMVAIDERIEQQDYPHSSASDSAAVARSDHRNLNTTTTNTRSVSADSQHIVTSLIFALRRGGSRHETQCAVSNLMELCNVAVGETSLEKDTTEGKAIIDPSSGKAIVKALLSAGILQSLLSTLPRVNDWPEIEKQLSKVISILVTYEEDRQLLRRNAGTILTALYTLQIKSSSSSVISADDDTNKSGSEELVDEHEHTRGLIATAVAKLSSVLSSEWTSPDMGFGHGNLQSSVDPSSSTRNGMLYGGGFMDTQGLPSIVGANPSSGTNRNSWNSSRMNKGADNDRILQILVNFIVTLCVSASPSSSPSPSTVDALEVSSAAAAPPSPPLSTVSSAVIQCSAALLHLAEVPLCRPGLVSNGALKLIKSWLELGTAVLGPARARCFEVTDALDSSTNHYDDDGHGDDDANSFCIQFGPVYQLVGNAAAALMFISGGIDHSRSQIGGLQVTAPSAGNGTSGSIDYVVGWIDAQILSEGLPVAVITLIDASVESFTEAFNTNDVSATSEAAATASSLPSRSTRSVLPAAISMHLVQTLFELNSRPQNRQQLRLINIPHALCVLFENISSQIELIVGGGSQASLTKLDGGSTSGKNQHPVGAASSPAAEEEREGSFEAGTGQGASHLRRSARLFKQIFYFGFESDSFIKSRSSLLLLNSTLTGCCHKETGSMHWSSSFDSPPIGFTNSNSNHLLPDDEIQQLLAAPSDRVMTRAPVPLPRDLVIILSSVTSSCLDVLASVADEERNLLCYSSPHGAAAMPPMLSFSAATANAAAQFSLSRHPSISTSNSHSIFDLICHRKIIKSIKIASSLLRDGKGRLSTMKVIATLTERCDCFQAVFEGGIVDVLLDMSREAAWRQAQLQAEEELKTAAVQRPSSHHHHHQQQQRPSNSSWTGLAAGLTTRLGDEFPSTIGAAASDALSFLSFFPGRPSFAERTTSGGSSLSGLSAGTSNYAKNSSSSSRYRTGTGPAAALDELDDDERVEICNEVLREQTLYVCYSLANLCEDRASQKTTEASSSSSSSSVNYAQYCYSKDLFRVMLRLVRTRCCEINRHALRCISAMCLSIAAPSSSSSGVADSSSSSSSSEGSMVGKGLLQSSPSLPATAGQFSMSLKAMKMSKADRGGEFLEALGR